MQVVNIFFLSFVLFFSFVKAQASGLKDSVSVGINSYSDNGDVQVYSPTFSLMKTLSKNFLVGFKMRVDAIAAASIRNGSNPVQADAVAGASTREGYDDVRYAPTFLMAYDDGENAASGGFYYSTENDYDGVAFFANYVRQLNHGNTAVGVGFSQSADRWKPVFDRRLPNDYRNERKIDLSVNQLLTPETSVQLVYSYMYSEGFLSSPYHYALQDSFARFENYPSARTGHAVALKGVMLLSDANSMNYAYRYYQDDWGISSHTLQAEWLHDFGDSFTSGTRLRYYSQSGADFAKKPGSYAAWDEYFAIDYRMSAFDSYDIGIPLIYKPSSSSSLKISASIDYYQTSDNEFIRHWYAKDNLNAFYTTLTFDYSF